MTMSESLILRIRNYYFENIVRVTKENNIMADTKKEHYVPRCYLKNFSHDDRKINVFDKFKMQNRNQPLQDVAMENYFYDVNMIDMLKKVDEEKRKQLEIDLMKLVGTDDWEDVLKILRKTKYIEKEFFAEIEGLYSELLQRIINKSYDGNQWVLNNCFAFSEEEKLILSLFIAIQIIRTKVFRDILGDSIEKMYQTLLYKMQMNREDALEKEEIKVEVDKDFVKLQHSSMILNDRSTVEMAEILSKHIWIMYVNKTEMPFYTSDCPVINIPHKFDEYVSYGGVKSEGIEIAFPISSKLLLAMYDENYYKTILEDRKFICLKDQSQIEYYNYMQLINSDRCIFCEYDNFEYAKKICVTNPKLQERQSRIEVL